MTMQPSYFLGVTESQGLRKYQHSLRSVSWRRPFIQDVKIICQLSDMVSLKNDEHLRSQQVRLEECIQLVVSLWVFSFKNTWLQSCQRKMRLLLKFWPTIGAISYQDSLQISVTKHKINFLQNNLCCLNIHMPVKHDPYRGI